MPRARRVVLILLAALAIAFAVTWSTLPTSTFQSVGPPASWFAAGLDRYGSAGPGPRYVNAHQLERRVYAFYGGLAAATVLLGLAFGAGRRSENDRG